LGQCSGFSLWGAKIRIKLLNKPICRQDRVFAPHTVVVLAG
jgi:hypothetical protein